MTTENGHKNVENLIDRFGGMRPMARKMNIAVSTIQGWKKRQHIPEDRVDQIIKAAKTHNVSLDGFNLPQGANENNTPSETTTQTETPTETVAPKPSPVAPPTSPKATKTTPQTKPKTTDYIDPAQIRREAVRRSVMTTCGIIALVIGTGYVLFSNEAKEIASVAENQAQIESRLDGLSDQFGSFENTVTEGLNSLSERITDVAAAVGVERNENGDIILNNNLSLSERITALESRLRAAGQEIDLGQIMARFETLTQSVDGQTQIDASLNDLKAIIDVMQGRMNQLDQALEVAKQDNDALARSLENVSGRDLSAAAMLLALTQFRTSMNREQPFAEDLETLQGLVGEDDPQLTAAINRLAPHAESGVLTSEGLSKELRMIAGNVTVAALSGEDVSIKDRVLGRLGQILSIKQDGKPLFANKEQTLIAEAQAALDRDDVQTALQKLQQLDGEAAKVAAPLTQKAQGTLNAQNTATMLMEKFLSKMNEPRAIQNFMEDIPRAPQGNVMNDPASGIIILE